MAKFSSEKSCTTQLKVIIYLILHQIQYIVLFEKVSVCR